MVRFVRVKDHPHDSDAKLIYLDDLLMGLFISGSWYPDVSNCHVLEPAPTLKALACLIAYYEKAVCIYEGRVYNYSDIPWGYVVERENDYVVEANNDYGYVACSDFATVYASYEIAAKAYGRLPQHRVVNLETVSCV